MSLNFVQTFGLLGVFSSGEEGTQPGNQARDEAGLPGVLTHRPTGDGLKGGQKLLRVGQEGLRLVCRRLHLDPSTAWTRRGHAEQGSDRLDLAARLAL